MRLLLPLAIGTFLLIVLLLGFIRMSPADAARYVRIAGGVALLGIGAWLLLLRQFALALPVGLAGFIMLRRQARMRTGSPQGRTSSVRTDGLQMILDHETGEMDGRILAGRHAGRNLSELHLEQLLQVAEDFRDDAESSRVLETYLDRAHSGWREDVEADEARRQAASPRAGGMSAQEAYEILGLEPGASEADVRSAHRRLMKQVHPDRGGSAALAAKINEAKERILGKHR